MSLVMNGVIIPTDVANAMNFNGNDVTQVFINGVEVWKQNLFSATWSGSSLSASNQGNPALIGVETSGSSYRMYFRDFNNNVSRGPFVAVTQNGFPVASSFVPVTFIGDVGIGSVSNTDFGIHNQGSQVPGMQFSTVSGFSGSAEGPSGDVTKGIMGTSGGLMRYAYELASTNWGAFISLT